MNEILEMLGQIFKTAGHSCPHSASDVPPWAKSEAIIDKARRNMEKLKEKFRT